MRIFLKPFTKISHIVVLTGMYFMLSACGGGNGGTTVNTTVVSPVAVSAVFPAEARAGETITVSGQQFGVTQGTSTLRINGVTATQITSWSDTRIEAIVPVGATTGNVTVSVGGVAGAPGRLNVLWQATNPVNVALSNAPLDQVNPQLTSDDAGGAIVVWQDHRVLTDVNNGGGDIYVQRVNNAGVPQWAADGVAISITARGKVRPQIVSDGMGGAIVVWVEIDIDTTFIGTTFTRGISTVYAQRVNSSGVPQWGANGVNLGATVSTGVVLNISTGLPIPQVVADGAGGAIIVWEEFSVIGGTLFRQYIQRVNNAGVKQWGAGGVAFVAQLSRAPHRAMQLLADGAGGAFVAWAGGPAVRIYAQYVNSAGVPQWAVNGVAVVGGVSPISSRPKLTTDGAGGVIIAWNGGAGLTAGVGLVAQRVNNVGMPQWGLNGVTIPVTGTNPVQVQITTDDAGGAIVGWTDTINIYVQRLNGAGVVQWAATGVAFGVAEPVVLPETTPLQLISDNTGGAMVVWEDFRSGVNDIYAQRVNDAGVPQWVNATTVSTAADRQALPQLVADGVGVAVVVWQDRRNGSDYGIHAQGITASGRQ